MNVQVEHIVRTDADRYRATANGKIYHVVLRRSSTNATTTDIEIFDDRGVGTTGTYDATTNSLYDAGKNIALLNVVASNIPNPPSVHVGGGGINGGRFFRQITALKLDGRDRARRRQRKQRKKKILTTLLLLLVCGGAVLQGLFNRQGNLTDGVGDQIGQVFFPSHPMPPSPPNLLPSGTISVESSTPANLLNPIVDTTAVCTFLHNISHLVSLVPGRIFPEETSEPLKGIPTPMSYYETTPPNMPFREAFPAVVASSTATNAVGQPDVPMVTVTNKLMAKNPVLQCLVNETSAHTQCLVNNILLGEYPSVSQDFVDKVQVALEKEREIILSTFATQDGRAFEELTSGMNRIVEPIEFVGETIYHSAKYTNMTCSMVQDLLDVANQNDVGVARKDRIDGDGRRWRKGMFDVVKAVTANALEMTTWVLETQYIHVTQPVLEAVGSLANVLFSGETAELLGRTGTGMATTVAGWTYNAVTGQYERVSKPMGRMALTVTYATIDGTTKTWKLVSESAPRLAAKVGQATHTGVKMHYKYVQTPLITAAMEATAGQYRYITRPMLKEMWNVAARIATPPSQYDEFDQSLSEHLKESLESVKRLSGALYEMVSFVGWSVKSTESALDNTVLLDDLIRNSTMAERKFVNTTLTVKRATDNVFKVAKDAVSDYFAPDVDNIDRAATDLNKLLLDFAHERTPPSLEGAVLTTSMMEQYVNKAKRSEAGTEDLAVLSPADEILRNTMPLKAVPMEIAPMSELATSMTTTESTVVVANVQEIGKPRRSRHPLQPYSPNDPFHPSNTLVTAERAMSRARSRSKSAKEHVLSEKSKVAVDRKIVQVTQQPPDKIAVIPESIVLDVPVVVDPVVVDPVVVTESVASNPLQTLGDKIQETNDEIDEISTEKESGKVDVVPELTWRQKIAQSFEKNWAKIKKVEKKKTDGIRQSTTAVDAAMIMVRVLNNMDDETGSNRKRSESPKK